jgi:hypothetical protein
LAECLWSSHTAGPENEHGASELMYAGELDLEVYALSETAATGARDGKGKRLPSARVLWRAICFPMRSWSTRGGREDYEVQNRMFSEHLLHIGLAH